MDDPEERPEEFRIDPVYLAMIVEGGLILVALSAGWLLTVDPLATLRWTPEDLPLHGAALGWGVLAALPLLGAMLLTYRFPVGPLGGLRRLVEETMVPMFRGAGVVELALISLLAGVGEELLFRGVLQAALAGWIGGPLGAWIAIAAASVVFGLCHAVSRTYFVLATLISVYLGLLFVWTGNLLAPMAAHAVYDFAALVYLLYLRRGAEAD
jgi:hypothetical protein